ncbi:unnamed protein product [Symbiodinium sp. CCMP2592]|nr:unnamed protein product [Symbiodinium sp. CCMP2592]
MLVLGLTISQLSAGHLNAGAYALYGRVVGVLTMFALSFLMVNVGHEFVIERSKLGNYAQDYLVAMSAAGLPWIFVALWLHFALPNSGLAWGSALLMARFAAPTSAGILFNMLEAAGFKETWLFRKAQILAIFDDLDTILLMIPLKMYLVGFKWELSFDAVFVTLCLGLAWQKLHKIRLQSSWSWTMLYAGVITACCEGLCNFTSGRIHIEVLLPAFVMGCMTRICEPKDDWCELLDEKKEEAAKSLVSTFFMLLVGMSMPSLFTAAGHLTAGQMVFHVTVVSLLMILGKMMLLFCYRKEANLRTRLALSLGMCPRGEVGAGVIAISLGLGMQGPAVAVAVLSLAANLVLSTGFIMMIDRLMRSELPSEATAAPPAAAASAKKPQPRRSKAFAGRVRPALPRASLRRGASVRLAQLPPTSLGSAFVSFQAPGSLGPVASRPTSSASQGGLLELVGASLAVLFILAARAARPLRLVPRRLYRSLRKLTLLWDPMDKLFQERIYRQCSHQFPENRASPMNVIRFNYRA